MNTATSEIVGSGIQSWCVATVQNPSSGRVQAVAQCCDIGEYAKCGTVQNNGGALTTAVCDTSNVVGCVSAGEACAHDNDCYPSWITGNHPCDNHQQNVQTTGMYRTYSATLCNWICDSIKS